MDQISLEQAQYLSGVESMLQSWSWLAIAAITAGLCLWAATAWTIMKSDWRQAGSGAGGACVEPIRMEAASWARVRVAFAGLLICVYLAAVCQVHLKLDLSGRPLLNEMLKVREALDPGFSWSGEAATGAQMAASRRWIQEKTVMVASVAEKLRLAGKDMAASALERDVRMLAGAKEGQS